MNFEQRKQTATELVVGFLGDFSPPRGLTDAQMASRISHVADAFARRMPADDKYQERIDQVFSRIRDTHVSNTWPTQAVFVMAMPQSEYRKGAPASFKPKDKQHIADQMAQGLAVPENEIWKNLNVSREVSDRYRMAAVDGWREVYGVEAHQMMQEKYGPIVSQYFLGATK